MIKMSKLSLFTTIDEYESPPNHTVLRLELNGVEGKIVTNADDATPAFEPTVNGQFGTPCYTFKEAFTDLMSMIQETP